MTYLSELIHRYFVGLGAVEDFSDELVVYAYERQKDCDPDHAPFYLSWLQEIAGRRGSELLQTKVALMESSGEISYRDINHAYQYFQANPTWDDATIIGAFRSRLEDAPRQEAEARQHLRAIGVVRQSEIIQSTALNSGSQLLSWLHASLTHLYYQGLPPTMKLWHGWVQKSLRPMSLLLHCSP